MGEDPRAAASLGRDEAPVDDRAVARHIRPRRCCFSTSSITELHPQARHVVRYRLYRLKRQGVTLFLTTHYMDEAEQLCDRRRSWTRGRSWPRDRRGAHRALFDPRSPGAPLRGRRPAPKDFSYWTDGLVSRVEPARPRAPRHRPGRCGSPWHPRARPVPESVLVRRSTLEDVFLHLTGRSLIE